MAPAACPEGFAVERCGRGLLYARPELLGALRDVGLTGAERWSELLAQTSVGPGRGTTARLELPGGPRVVLKKMRRGGLTARLWHDRFPGRRRLLANLVLPAEAARRGIPTPAAVALLLRPGALGTHEGWLMTEALEGARDLLTILRAGSPARGMLTAVMAGVRAMHDRGLHHPDLNLANLLVRVDEGGHHVFVIDLDRARLERGALAYRGRLSAIRRIERSYLKNFGAEGPLGPDPGRVWYATYAGGDGDLARRLEASRRAGRVWLELHRLGWKR